MGSSGMNVLEFIEKEFEKKQVKTNSTQHFVFCVQEFLESIKTIDIISKDIADFLVKREVFSEYEAGFLATELRIKLHEVRKKFNDLTDLI